MKFLLMLIFSLVVAACGGSHGTSRPLPTPPSNPPPIYRIGDMDAQAFYNQFLFEVSGSCRRGATTYRYVKSHATKISVNKLGQDVLAELSILMLKDKSYVAHYLEMDVTDYVKDGFYWNTSRERILRGTWLVVENRLEFPGLGVGMGIRGKNYPAMLLTIKADLITAGLQNHVAMMTNVESTYLPVPSADPCR